MVYEYANGVQMFAIGRAQTGCHDEVSDHILGTKGRANLLEVPHRRRETRGTTKAPRRTCTTSSTWRLFDAIRSGKPINNGTYMARSTMLAVLGQMVCYSGQQITWEEAMKSELPGLPRRLPLGHGAAGQAGRQRHLPGGDPGRDAGVNKKGDKSSIRAIRSPKHWTYPRFSTVLGNAAVLRPRNRDANSGTGK